MEPEPTRWWSKAVIDPVNTVAWFSMDALWLAKLAWPAYLSNRPVAYFRSFLRPKKSVVRREAQGRADAVFGLEFETRAPAPPVGVGRRALEGLGIEDVHDLVAQPLPVEGEGG